MIALLLSWPVQYNQIFSICGRGRYSRQVFPFSNISIESYGEKCWSTTSGFCVFLSNLWLQLCLCGTNETILVFMSGEETISVFWKWLYFKSVIFPANLKAILHLQWHKLIEDWNKQKYKRQIKTLTAINTLSWINSLQINSTLKAGVGKKENIHK